MAFDCANASSQYFTIAAPNITVPPVTFSIWFNVASVVPKHTAMFLWRDGIDTGLLLRYISSNWTLRYYVLDGPEWNTDTGLYVTPGVWQHACVAITTSQARVYLDGAVFTNNVSHASASLNAAGLIGRDNYPDANHSTFNGALAEPAVWNVALSDAECLALAKRISPLALVQRLPNLVLYRDMIRDLSRGFGPAIAPVNAPAVAPHPPLHCVGGRRQLPFRPARFQAPFRPHSQTVQASRLLAGSAASAGTAAGLTLPGGEVSS